MLSKRSSSNFSAHVSDDHQQVRANMVSTIKDMVERFKKVVNSNEIEGQKTRGGSKTRGSSPRGANLIGCSYCDPVWYVQTTSGSGDESWNC